MITNYYDDSNFYDENYFLDDNYIEYVDCFLFTYSKTRSENITKKLVCNKLEGISGFKENIQNFLIVEENYHNINDSHIHVYLQLESPITFRYFNLDQLKINPSQKVKYQKVDKRNPFLIPNILGLLQKEDSNPFTNFSEDILLKSKTFYINQKKENLEIK